MSYLFHLKSSKAIVGGGGEWFRVQGSGFRVQGLGSGLDDQTLE